MSLVKGQHCNVIVLHVQFSIACPGKSPKVFEQSPLNCQDMFYGPFRNFDMVSIFIKAFYFLWHFGKHWTSIFDDFLEVQHFQNNIKNLKA